MSLRHAILGVLEYHPLHGYALKRVLERAEMFKNHADPRIAAAAQDMLFGLASI